MAKEVGNIIKEKEGAFYRYSTDGKLETIATDVSISNGMGWNANKTLMYYIDSPNVRVDAFDFDPHTAQASNRRPFFDFTSNNVTGVPDGMTMDAEDNLWIACFNGSKVIKVSGSTGSLLGWIEIPAERITSAVFGGEDLKTLYVTSAKFGLTTEQLEAQPQAGCIFSVEGLGVKGTTSNPVVVTNM